MRCDACGDGTVNTSLTAWAHHLPGSVSVGATTTRFVFWLCETACGDGWNPAQPTFQFSQQVAEFVRAAGFDGMLVPGVRGREDRRYSNLVLFTHAGWRGWLRGPITQLPQVGWAVHSDPVADQP